MKLSKTFLFALILSISSVVFAGSVVDVPDPSDKPINTGSIDSQG